jgi:hypothetical protein
MKPTLIAATVFSLALLFTEMAGAQVTVTLEPLKDNSIFEEDGSLSNGADDNVFVGTELTGMERRALLAFDTSSIPAGSVVTSVELTMNMNRTIAGAVDVSVHALQADWGEAGSVGAQGGGGGAAAQTGDATWTFRFFSTDSWNTQGGDFDATVLSSANVSNTGVYVFPSSAALVAEVQQWVDGGDNFGLILRADESAADPSAKRFASRESTASNRPKLTVTYTAGAAFPINQGMAGGWFNLDTAGQGFLFDVEPAGEFMFVAWFTYEEASAKVGSADHRWLTAQGNYSGGTADLTLFNTSGGAFDDPAGTTTNEAGTLSITFSDCSNATVSYDLPGDGLQGSFAIQRLIPGTEALCESLNASR